MAWRTTRSMWPSLTSVPEWQSSVQRMKLRGSSPFSVTAVICASTSYQAEPRRSIARIPWRTRAMASASRRALVIVGRAAGGIGVESRAKVGARRNGRRRSCRRPGSRRSRPASWGRRATTPGKFIISPRPTMFGPGHRLGDVLGRRVSAPVVSSPGAEGAQEGICTKTLTGCASASSCIRRTPSRPRRWRSRGGRRTCVVVPWGTTARTNSVDGQHAAFDMHVGVAEAGDEVAALGLDDLACPADAVAGIRAAIGEPPVGDGDLPAVEHLARVHVHPDGHRARPYPPARAPPRRRPGGWRSLARWGISTFPALPRVVCALK